MKSKVLDKGFIEVVDSLGNDLTVVNSARVSFGKRKKSLVPDIKLTEEDIEISLLELKRRVGSPKINFRKRR